MLNLTYEYKLIPTNAQRETLDQWLNICRKVYNFALRERKDWINSRKCDINSCSIKQEYIIPADAPRPTFALSVQNTGIRKEVNPRIEAPSYPCLAASVAPVRGGVCGKVGSRARLS